MNLTFDDEGIANAMKDFNKKQAELYKMLGCILIEEPHLHIRYKITDETIHLQDVWVDVGHRGKDTARKVILRLLSEQPQLNNMILVSAPSAKKYWGLQGFTEFVDGYMKCDVANFIAAR